MGAGGRWACRPPRGGRRQFKRRVVNSPSTRLTFQKRVTHARMESDDARIAHVGRAGFPVHVGGDSGASRRGLRPERPVKRRHIRFNMSVHLPSLRSCCGELISEMLVDRLQQRLARRRRGCRTSASGESRHDEETRSSLTPAISRGCRARAVSRLSQQRHGGLAGGSPSGRYREAVRRRAVGSMLLYPNG